MQAYWEQGVVARSSNMSERERITISISADENVLI